MTLHEFENIMDSCSRCSKCKFLPALQIKSKEFSHICPSIEYYNFHAYSGGGRMIMANALLKERIEITPELLEVLYRCTNCGGCEVACKFIYDLEPNEVIHELRSHCVEQGAGPMPKHKDYITNVDTAHNPYGEEHSHRMDWLPKNVELDANAETFYFAGCTASYRRHEIAKATVQLLNRGGQHFNLLNENEFCCGSPVYRVGDRKRAIEYMTENADRFKELGVRRIITSCSGCYNMLKIEYPRFVNTDIEVLHTSQILEQLINTGKLKLTKKVPLKITYHDPCHLGRMAEPYTPWEGERIEVLTRVYLNIPPKPIRRGAEGVYDSPRNVIRQIPGIEFIEMERIREYAYCCGAGAGVKAQYPDFALWTANRRLDEAESTTADVLVSCCPFCSTNFQDAMKTRTSKMRFFDLTELVLQSVGGDD
ncbi:MAG: (Fe-S)-binding protein [Promethearchaeota archaeon]